MKVSQLKEQIRRIIREKMFNEARGGRIPKLFLKIEAVKKEIDRLTSERKSKFGGEYAKKFNAEKDPKKREQLTQPILVISKKITELQKNLLNLYAMEEKYIQDLDKDAELELEIKEAITNPKKSNPNDLATTVIGWYDFATDYIDDGGQRRTAIKNNEDVVKWFDSHPLDVKQKAFKVMLSKQPSIKSKIERIFSSSLKEGDGLWANIQAKKARGEKSSPKNSQAYKDAVKAGKEISEAKTYKKGEATLNEKKYYVTYNRGRGQGKDLEKEFDQKTFKTTNKPKVFNSYNDAKKYAEKMEKMFRNSIGGGTAYWVSDEKMNPIKESVITEDTRRVKLLGIDFKISEMNGRIFFSFVDKKAASIQLRQIGTNKIVNHIQNRLDIAYGKGTFFFKSGDHAEFQNGYLFQRNTPDINLNKLKFESVNESVNFNGYVSSTDGKTFTLYNSDKKKIKDVSFDDLKNKYMKTYLGQNLKDFKDSFDKTTSKGKYWQYWKGKLVNVKLSNIDESINEATEPEIISQLKDIVKNKQYKMIKDPKTGKSLGVDMQTANAVLQIYDGLSNVNKDNMVKMGLPKMIGVSFKIINKYKK